MTQPPRVLACVFLLLIVLGKLFLAAAHGNNIEGAWTCQPVGVPRSKTSVEHFSFKTGGIMYWRGGQIFSRYFYKIDNSTLILSGEGLPGTLKWKIKFRLPQKLALIPVQGKILPLSCTREHIRRQIAVASSNA